MLSWKKADNNNRVKYNLPSTANSGYGTAFSVYFRAGVSDIDHAAIYACILDQFLTRHSLPHVYAKDLLCSSEVYLHAVTGFQPKAMPTAKNGKPIYVR